jgi:alcohol dehydrogenase, propanol-preferring
MVKKNPAAMVKLPDNSQREMTAARFYEPYSDLKIEKCFLPEPSGNEVLIKVETCSICHTDLQFIDRGMATIGKPPIILGHEIAGTIEIPDRNGYWRKGERVLVPATISCQKCLPCINNQESQCSEIQFIGNSIDGGFAQFMRVPDDHPIRLPDKLSFEDGAIVSNLFIGAYHVVFDRALIHIKDIMVIFGAGGFGLSILQMAKLRGAKVIIIDIFDWKLEIAKELGADWTLNSNKVSHCETAVLDILERKADVVIETIGAPRTMVQAINLLRKGGQLILSGYTDNQLPFLAGQIIRNEFSLIGTMSAPRKKAPEVLRLLENGRLRTAPLITHRFSLENINSAINTLRMGQSIRTLVYPWAQGMAERLSREEL